MTAAKHSQLQVISHVARDLLQSAALFRTEAAVVWEYVVNSLQYVGEGVTPKIQVTVDGKGKEIRILDNGRGMSSTDLQQFFTMHGENVDRKRGRPGRGKFGTGKSAAFGIANHLKVETIKNGIQNVVELDRKDIEESDGQSIPVHWVSKNKNVDLPNGTTVVISGISLPRLTTAPIIEYIERNLQVFRTRLPEVAVNEHLCAYREPLIVERHEFRPNPEQTKVLGDVTLTIKVAGAPLSEAEQGIAVTAGLGNLVAQETGGIDRKEMGNYLFGEVDVPALESFVSAIFPYDSSRSLKLNPHHPVSMTLIQFIGSKLDEIRKQQVSKLRDQRRSEESRRLAQLAEKIADVLNEDFQEVSSHLQAIRAASRAGGLRSRFAGPSTAASEPEGYVEGFSEPGNINRDDTKSKDGPPKARPPRSAPEIPPTGEQSSDGTGSVDPTGGESGKKRNPRGGFSVDYRALGETADRSRYDANTLTILINLDHPVIKAAQKWGGTEDPAFKRLSYEVAFSEYAIAFGYEKAKQDPDMPAFDLLFEVRTTLNRVSARAAALYS